MRRVLAMPWLAGGLALAMAAASGCTSSDCTEKAVCPDDAATTDGAADATAAEATAGDARSEDASPGDAGPEVASDAATSGDARDAGPGADAAVDGTAPCVDGYVCIDPVPIGWTGPLALFDQTGTPAPAPPPCPPELPTVAFDGHADPDAAPASCGCSCGTPAGAQCSAPTVRMFFGGCPGGSACGTYDATASCVGTLCAAAGSAIATSEPDGGACTPQPSSSVPPWGWMRTARACTPASLSGPCGAGGAQVCAPAPPLPFASRVCIAQAGDTACPPSSSYSDKHLYYGGATDDRGCTPCACSAPAGIGCSAGTVTLFTQGTPPTCGGSSEGVPTDGLCHAVTVSAAGVATTTMPSPSGGQCTPDGGQPSGLLTPAAAETVCCQP